MAELVITKDNFEQEVIKAQKPVVIDFWAPWCGPCRMMGPVVAKFAEEFGDKYVVGKVNIDDEEELAERFGIMSIPTIKVFKGGQEVASGLGAMSREKLLELVGE
ncbi:MAG: thioredoxin [Lachnospiraceae bacterium]|nr:thioredoxin [Lachnospiraceae bacterium]MBR4574567.1 thioredoxin [Lachnospiraceae bacterium]